jgi:endonuclease III
MTKQEKVQEIIKRLYVAFPNPKTPLDFSNPFGLLIATMMAAQTTDKLVNKLTPDLFKKYPAPKDFVKSAPEEIAADISKVNFPFNKAKNIQAASQIIVEKYDGKVPDNMEELDALPGVARKTANVVLCNAFGKAEGIVVDTHVIRLSQRLGLSDQKDPVKIERDLMEIVPKDKWIDFANLITLFGREFCPARPHVCKPCPLGDLCPD